MRSLIAFWRSTARNRSSLVVKLLLTVITAGAAKLGAVWLLLRLGIGPRVLQAQDAMTTGIFAACLVFIFLREEQAQQEDQERRMDAVADLNHNVRNALEVIVCSEYLRRSDQGTAILASVERIDHALTTITAPVLQQTRRRSG
jgi:hypothetical protein